MKIFNLITKIMIVIATIASCIKSFIVDDEQLSIIYMIFAIVLLISLSINIIHKNIIVSTQCILHDNIVLKYKLDFILEKLYENDKEGYEKMKEEYSELRTDNIEHLDEHIKNIK